MGTVLQAVKKIDTSKKIAMPVFVSFMVIRLRLNTLQLAAGMKGEVNRAEARQSVGGLGYGAIPL